MRRDEQALLALAQVGDVAQREHQAARAIEQAQRDRPRLAGGGGAAHRHARLVGVVLVGISKGVGAGRELLGLEHRLERRAGVEPVAIGVDQRNEVGRILG